MAVIDKTIWPELRAGDRLRTKTGVFVTLVATRERNQFDEILFRLRFASGITGNARWSRERLQEVGCEYMEREQNEIEMV